MLKSLNHFLKRTISQCLHLSLTIPNGFLYTTPKDGGLGIFIFRARVSQIVLIWLNNIREEGDSRVLSVLSITKLIPEQDIRDLELSLFARRTAYEYS